MANAVARTRAICSVLLCDAVCASLGKAAVGTGSLGYASRLSRRADYGGQLGLPEHIEDASDVESKCVALAELLRSAKRVVAFTGAGVSTSCGVPDFRGPNGVWTRERQGLPPPEASLPFELARPGLTHMAIKTLHAAGKVVYVISQNVDCLHLRSGIPRHDLAELHGNTFAERCEICGTEFVRDFEVESVGFKPTGRTCTAAPKRRRSGGSKASAEGSVSAVCGGRLRDNCLDWEDALPVPELRRSERECRDACVVLCLGTSMEITPACNLPLRAVRKGGKMVIINMQKTPKDKKAVLVIRAKVDDVMRRVMGTLGMPIEDYVRIDRLRLVTRFGASATEELADAANGDRGEAPDGANAGTQPARPSFQLSVRNAGGTRCPPPPFVARLTVWPQGAARAASSATPRLSVRVRHDGDDEQELAVELALREGVRPASQGAPPDEAAVVRLTHRVQPFVGNQRTRGASVVEQEYAVETCRVAYSAGVASVAGAAAGVQEAACGDVSETDTEELHLEPTAKRVKQM